MTATETTTQKYHTFDLRRPFLGLGDKRAGSELMTIKMKVYEQGGENRMHRHPGEDHAFIVLEGEATFHLETDDNTRVLRQWDGLLLERDAFYWFENTGDIELVLLRFGAMDPSKPQKARFTDGSEKHGRKD